MSARDDYNGAQFGGYRYERMCDEIDRLRAECKVWMNAVADAVEPLGYDREAACGPADLLPGLKTLAVLWATVQVDIYPAPPIQANRLDADAHENGCLATLEMLRKIR